MKTVNEVSKLTGLSIRTLQYYDNIGLLKPASQTESGYRLYGDKELEVLQQIMLFRELEFPLKEIKVIIDDPGFDRSKAMDQHIKLLQLRKERLDKLIRLAQNIRDGGKTMSFKAFDNSKYEEYAKEAKKVWGNTKEYSEYENISQNRSAEENKILAEEMMSIFEEFGYIKISDPGSAEASRLVKKLQDHITGKYYKCTDEILRSLGEMYVSDTRFKENIDKAGGEGTAVFVNEAIKAYIK